MSASLVGSEMCIRDRVPHPTVPFGVHAVRVVELGLLLVRCLRCLGRQEGCLLYTSDAADDM
eukprot:5491165-Alexandrium_andersonii.AAC.1